MHAVTANRWLGLAIVVVLILLVVAVSLYFIYRPMVVPDLIGKTRTQAAAVLDEAALALGTVSEVATTSAQPGFIIEQSVAPNELAARHSSVDVTIAVAPVASTVPDVVGADQADASAKLAESKYVMAVEYVFSDDVAEGSVVSQLPTPGTEWTTGRPVAVAVSLGADDGTGVEVPSLVGMSTQTALSTAEESGLAPSGFVVDPNAVTESVVVSQLPKAGVRVPPGTQVLLLFDNE